MLREPLVTELRSPRKIRIETSAGTGLLANLLIKYAVFASTRLFAGHKQARSCS
jgi:hypothetical protein